MIKLRKKIAEKLLKQKKNLYEKSKQLKAVKIEQKRRSAEMLRNFAFASAVAVLTMSCACYFTVKTAYRSCEKKRIEATYVSKNYEMPQTEDGTVMREISIIDQDA